MSDLEYVEFKCNQQQSYSYWAVETFRSIVVWRPERYAYRRAREFLVFAWLIKWRRPRVTPNWQAKTNRNQASRIIEGFLHCQTANCCALLYSSIAQLKYTLCLAKARQDRQSTVKRHLEKDVWW